MQSCTGAALRQDCRRCSVQVRSVRLLRPAPMRMSQVAALMRALFEVVHSAAGACVSGDGCFRSFPDMWRTWSPSQAPHPTDTHTHTHTHTHTCPTPRTLATTHHTRLRPSAPAKLHSSHTAAKHQATLLQSQDNLTNASQLQPAALYARKPVLTVNPTIECYVSGWFPWAGDRLAPGPAFDSAAWAAAA